jgi:RimK family alpha-L-glutamate ligase
MKIAILAGEDGWHIRDLRRAADELGATATIVDFRRISSDDLREYDAAIVRTMPPGSLEQVVFRMDRLHELESLGVPILNPPRSLEICVDKYLCNVRLERAGLRVPPTIVCQTGERAMAAFEEFGRDVVVKPIFGSEGRGMVRISNPELAWRTFRTIERTDCVLYVQKYIDHPGWDLRAFVVDGRVVAAMKRTAHSDWRTNVSQGAKAEAVTLELHLQQLAIQAAAATGTIVAGVDLLPGPDGEWYALEVNAVPGWKAISAATGVDIAAITIERCLMKKPAKPSKESLLHLACVWEATARKAGNVHPGASFDDLTYADFLMSAAMASPILAKATSQSLGVTILEAIRSTKATVRTNTNLGIVLLLAPLAKAVGDLRSGVERVLANTTIADSVQIFEAIRVAVPGGLGQSREQDVRDVPTLPFVEIMKLAADRDSIARQYVTGFRDVFEIGVPAIVEGVERFGRIEPAIQHAQLVLMSKIPDSLIARKLGNEVAKESARRAHDALLRGESAYVEFDGWLRADGHRRNPGTTADLIAASLYVALVEEQIAIDAPW